MFFRNLGRAIDPNRQSGSVNRPYQTSRGAKCRHQSRAAQALLGSGDSSVVAPPVPIPNTEVKRCSPDGSTATGRARVGRRQNKNPAGFPGGVFSFRCCEPYSRTAQRNTACRKENNGAMADETPPPPRPAVPQTLPRYSARRDLASHSSCSFIYVRLNGHPARQDELTGTEKGANVVFLRTTVDNGDRFQQILAWTLKSQWQKQDQSMREVTASLRSEK